MAESRIFHKSERPESCRGNSFEPLNFYQKKKKKKRKRVFKYKFLLISLRWEGRGDKPTLCKTNAEWKAARHSENRKDLSSASHKRVSFDQLSCTARLLATKIYPILFIRALNTPSRWKIRSTFPRRDSNPPPFSLRSRTFPTRNKPSEQIILLIPVRQSIHPA